MQSILFIGGTGYIGGPIMSRFIERNDPNHNITALVRSAEKAERLNALKLRVNVVVGSHNDAPLVERLAAEADVVFSLADCDDLQAAESILRGLSKRFEATQRKPILIHMSGTGALGDQAKGMFASDRVISDLDIEAIEALPPTASHRHVDLAIVEADSQGYTDTYIVLPGVVYGTPHGVLAEAGVQNPSNFATTGLIQVSVERGAAGIVGEGKNITSHVDVDEVADMVELLYNGIVEKRVGVEHGRKGYYFVDNGAIEFSELVKVIETKAGKRRPLTQAELDKHFPGRGTFHAFLGDNSRCNSERSRGLGWRPVKTNADFLVALEDELKNWKP
ncbi:hypothetical protein C8R43DRAFT_1050133 [Mycena crocata]|nr:hypothetical protein C8R43DRAFT_1050133 [Mycena crocata]